MDGTEPLICIKCDRSRFPRAEEQCYKMGGLICTLDNANVGKYNACRFADDKAKLHPNE